MGESKVDGGYAHIGRPLARVEDARHLAGGGAFVADIQMSGCLEVAFCRSPVAHGRLRGVTLPPEFPAGTFWSAADIAGLALPIYCALLRPEFNGAPYPLLADGKVRFAGEPVVLALGATRAEAEERAEQVQLDIEPLAAVVDAWDEIDHPGVPLHDHLASNLVMRIGRALGDAQAIIDDPAARGLRQVTRRLSMGRVLASPLECRGCLAYPDPAGGVIVHVSSQRPHLIRTFLAEQIPGLAEADIRVVVPDVGGGFGSKSNLYPEEVLVTALAWKLRRPVRWIEDRYEHFVASNHSRQHEQRITAYFDDTGRIHALDALVVVDAGAYSAKTSTGAIEANMATNVMLGPYDIRNYRFEAVSIHTNKSPLGPYRGVGRPGGCFAMERIIEEVARELGADPLDVRRANLIAPAQMPYVSATGLAYDSGNYREIVDAAGRFVAENWPAARQADDGGRVGVGYAMLVEQAAHGAEEWRRRGSPLIYGHESARATLNMDGTLVIEVGTLSHGQGHFTSLAQIAAEITTLPISAIRIRQGDTSAAPYGLGSVASRSIVMAGGAVAMACRDIVGKARAIHAVLHETDEARVEVRDGACVSPQGTTSFGDLARVAYVGVSKLPRSISPGFSFQADYRPSVETGTFSYTLHAARVSVDPDTGFVRILDYLVVEDCGTVVNPLILDGQIRGGVAQGIGQALYEEMIYDSNGQPQTVTFGDYAVPSAVEVPPISILHFSTPSPHSEFGMKGMGEGGAVAPPAAIANAVRDALADLGVDVCRTPITPDYLLRQLHEAGQGGAR
ncbi:xanthine dehydrogenase family protein molybdopterin-binding subunit [Pigmentiphaga sp.]|uniref:xanthine dehydrogenase family protein molybdopterin-binding subunit n=1 Tax=Pigmentiphaga sp. TaxID=1977564 RepID=UPI00128B18F1|nr:xanthine dehydrogenase family protein molybdopterin-binding subunit [Pigmentiphaga sp.]MPS26328.1 hypothetical protein [Alcaligenaceae bacterium SAGV5]MPS53415.1 hypothetical protein [Alcaligenaceae bacterium SAGV3]MPT56377.1 hypothetical protein [Alcaligenaceae bacterium]